MASKADLLKQGAVKTGSGLFKGMKPLESRENVEQKREIQSDDIVKSESKTEEVNENEAAIVKEEVITEPVVEIKPEVPEPIEAPRAKARENPVITAGKDNVTHDIKEADLSPKNINNNINIREKTSKIVESKSNSRYEKEKFLLLDIRGYRDYVEHMAKAANMSATKYIRNLIQLDMDKNYDIYQAHKELEEKLKGRTGN